MGMHEVSKGKRREKTQKTEKSIRRRITKGKEVDATERREKTRRAEEKGRKQQRNESRRRGGGKWSRQARQTVG